MIIPGQEPSVSMPLHGDGRGSVMGDDVEGPPPSDEGTGEPAIRVDGGLDPEVKLDSLSPSPTPSFEPGAAPEPELPSMQLLPREEETVPPEYVATNEPNVVLGDDSSDRMRWRTGNVEDAV